MESTDTSQVINPAASARVCSAVKIPAQTPANCQRRYSQYTHCQGPYYGGTFEFGDNQPHCYAGKIPEGVPMLSYYLPIFAKHMQTMAPKGADTESWSK